MGATDSNAARLSPHWKEASCKKKQKNTKLYFHHDKPLNDISSPRGITFNRPYNSIASLGQGSRSINWGHGGEFS